MNIFLVVVFYALTADGGLTKTTYETSASITFEQCELAAKVAKVDKELNTETSWVYSAHCELRKKPE